MTAITTASMATSMSKVNFISLLRKVWSTYKVVQRWLPVIVPEVMDLVGPVKEMIIELIAVWRKS